MTPLSTESTTARATAAWAGPKHLHRLLRALNRYLVEEERIGLARQVRTHHCQQSREPILVIRQRVAERRLCSRTARSDDEVDVRDLVAVADERLANHHFVDFGHAGFSSQVH